ncbi:MAG TPA: thioredoxin domain-containing protein [Pyrinomonadaceae bacterium]
MKYRNVLVAAALVGLTVIVSPVAAQTPKTKTGPKPAPKTTTPAKTGTTTTPAQKSTTPPPGTLAIVNGQAITLADFDPKVRQVVEGLDQKMPELRRDALDARINTILLENEAQKRKVTGEQLMDAEVNNLVKDPTDAEIQAVYDANRQQIGNADLATVRPQIIGYLRNQSAQKLAGELVTRLRSAHQVVKGSVDVNAPNLPPTAVLATVDGRPITSGDFEERLKPFVYKLRREVFEAEARAIDFKINQMLLEGEAKKRNMTPENVYKAEVTDKVRQPTDAEVTKFYEDNKTRIKGDLNSLRADIADVLRNQQLSRLESEFANRLRAGASVQVFLKEPQPPVQVISADDDPSRGEASAPVTVVVFTDFQCPSCAAMHPVIDETLKSYGNQVRLVIRDFPLVIHEQARKAAEAAAAASAQGKFFEYIAVLFKNQSALDTASLKKYASDLGLDRTRFDAALDNGQYAAEVSKDVSDGEAYGVDGTPAIFINGIRLRNLTAEGLRAAIDGALALKGVPTQKRAAK